MRNYVMLLALALGAVGCLENVDNGEIVVVQDPVDGELHVYTVPGLVGTNFGSVTHYDKSEQYWFSAQSDQGATKDESIKARFNDGGHAQISGSIRIEMPRDEKSVLDLHTTYRGWEAVMQQLVRTTVERAVYMTGPLMNSRESAAERRADLIRYIEDQIENGVYRIVTRDRQIVDPISGEKKTISEAIIERGDDGTPTRQEESPLKRFGVKAFNLSINSIAYEDAVENQIKTRQNALMQVEVAIAQSKMAEQQRLTVEQKGMAEAAEAKWKQEVVKAQAVTQAEQQKVVAALGAQQKLEVAQLDTQAAEQEKIAAITRAEGEAEAARKRINADGALKLKLDAYQAVHQLWAQAYQQQRPTPDFVVGGGSGGDSNPASVMMEALSIKALRDLGLDLGMRRASSAQRSQ